MGIARPVAYRSLQYRSGWSRDTGWPRGAAPTVCRSPIDGSMVNAGADDPDDRSLAIYRCVCGENVEVRQQDATCTACGRHYDRTVLNTAGADTISIDADHLPARLVTHPDHDPYIGESLGHFKILSRIGDGGMGAVYHALDESLQRYVALKVIHRGADEQGSADLARLFQEARAQARVNHPHVVHVYYVGIENETPFLAMELVGSGTLADRMREGTLSYQEIVRFAIQIARALGCAAEYDIVHGDIKPSNVLLVDNHTSKLSDFGLARRLSAPTKTASRMSGTPDYMPPESTLGAAVDHRGDMYALGVTLFQMTFERLPTRSMMTVICRIGCGSTVNRPLSSPSDGRPSCRKRGGAFLPGY